MMALVIVLSVNIVRKDSAGTPLTNIQVRSSSATMGNVVSYFMQKPEVVVVAKREGCCSGNKIERIEEPADDVAPEEIVETPATENVKKMLYN